MDRLLRVVKHGLTVALLLGLGFCVWVNLANAPDRAETKATNRQVAEQLITALESFRAAHGQYPEELDALVPGALPALPTLQHSGARLGYTRLQDGDDFIVSYPEAPLGTLPSDAEHVFQASTGQWENKLTDRMSRRGERSAADAGDPSWRTLTALVDGGGGGI